MCIRQCVPTNPKDAGPPPPQPCSGRTIFRKTVKKRASWPNATREWGWSEAHTRLVWWSTVVAKPTVTIGRVISRAAESSRGFLPPLFEIVDGPVFWPMALT